MVLYLRWSSSLPGSVFDTTCKSLATVADGQAYHARQGEALSQNEHQPHAKIYICSGRGENLICPLEHHREPNFRMSFVVAYYRVSTRQGRSGLGLGSTAKRRP